MYKECKTALNDILESEQKVYYKFTKSNKTLSNSEIFKENAYLNYTDNSIVVSKNDYGLSFCISYDKLLACAVYGDVLSQIIVDKDIVLRENLEKDKYLYGYFKEFLVFGEIKAKRLHIAKQFSMSNPSVLKECMKVANINSLHTFFGDNAINGKRVETMYEKLGFSESKHLIETMRECYNEHIKYEVNDLNSFRAKLEELFPTKEGDFSFSEEEQYYEQNKYTPEYNNLREDKVFSEDLFDSLDKPAPKKTGGFLALINKLRRKEQEKERPKPELEDEER